MAYKTFVAGEEALAADVNSYLMGQTVARFPTAAARTAQLTAPTLNQLTSRDDRPGAIEYWNGSAWVDISEISYTQITAGVTFTNGLAAQAHTVITDTSRTYDGSPIIVEFFAPSVTTPNIAGGQTVLNLWDGSTDLGYLAALRATSPYIQAPVHVRRRLVPTAAAHAYKIGGWVPFGGTGGSVVAGTGGIDTYAPAYLRITRA